MELKKQIWRHVESGGHSDIDSPSSGGARMGIHKEIIKASMRVELLEQFTLQGESRGTQLSTRWLYQHYLPTLSKKELIALEEVFAEMIEEKILEYVTGGQPTYRLTGKGENSL